MIQVTTSYKVQLQAAKEAGLFESWERPKKNVLSAAIEAYNQENDSDYLTIKSIFG